MLSMAGCKMAPIIEFDDKNDVFLEDWITFSFYEEDASYDLIDNVRVSFNDEDVLISHNIVDNNIVKIKPHERFQEKSKYLLTVDFESGKQYLKNFNTVSELVQDRVDLREEFFILPVMGTYDKEEADKMKKRILKVSDNILVTLYRAGVRMKLTNKPITNEPELQYLSGLVPRGWEYSGLTWDDVPGAGGYEYPIARIGYSEPGYQHHHDSVNLELHELAHTVDSYIAGKYIPEYISSSDEFIEIWQTEVFDFLPDEYFINYYEEYFAESFAMYYLNKDSRSLLETYAPKTFEFIANLDQLTNIETE